MTGPKKWELDRDARWRHNSYTGHARMMQMQLLAIAQSPTATDEARILANTMYIQAVTLGELLRKRKASRT